MKLACWEAAIRQPARLPWRLARRHEEYIFGEGADTRAAGNIFVCSDAPAFAARTRALNGGRLWHLFSDENSYVFLRETEEERLLVIFHNSNAAEGIAVYIGGHAGAESGSKYRDYLGRRARN